MRPFGLLALTLALAATGCVTAQPASAPPMTEASMEAEAMDTGIAEDRRVDAYRLYTAAGAPASLDDLVAAMQDADVVILGETHDDATTHALQLRLFQAAAALDRPVALSLEMFETDVQGVLDEYLVGTIRERDFLNAARPWGNYAGDYRPLVEFARERGLPVVAANAPQRYVSRVSRLGPESLDTLPSAVRTVLPPNVAPASVALEAEFTALMQGMMGHGHGAAPDSTVSDPTVSDAAAVHGSAPDLANLLHAQNLRDASMGHTIATYLDWHPGHRVIHLNGTFHSEGGLGVPEHLLRYRPETRTLIVTMRPDDAYPALDPAAFRGTDGFFVVVDPSVR
jgi:uncharacterized iron-regulated protein